MVRIEVAGKKLTWCIVKCFKIFKNGVFSLESGEKPDNSASHQVLDYVISQKTW